MVAVVSDGSLDRAAVADAGLPRQETVGAADAVSREQLSSPHARQLHEGFARLRFAGDLEPAFRDYYWQLNQQRRQLALFIAMALFVAFSIKDFLSLPDQVWPLTAGVRMGLVVPALLMAAVVGRRIERRMAESLLAIAGMAALYGLAGAYFFAVQSAVALPYEGMLLVVLYLYFMFGLRWRPAMWINLPFVPIFLVLSIAVEVPARLLVNQALYLITANLIGLVGCHVLEHLARRGYLSEALAKFRAERDSMTLIYNHGAVLDRLDLIWQRAAEQGAGVAVYLIDLDYFKRLNDSQGHRAGDAVLMRVAQALDRLAGPGLNMAGRYGGEEFVLLQYGLSPRDLQSRAEAIRAQIEALALPHLDAPAAVVTASVGGAYQRCIDGASPGDLIDAADAALYRAKAAGRNACETVCMDAARR